MSQGMNSESWKNLLKETCAEKWTDIVDMKWSMNFMMMLSSSLMLPWLRIILSRKKMNCSGSKFNHWRVLLNQSSTSATLRLRVCWKILISLTDSVAIIVVATSEPISASDRRNSLGGHTRQNQECCTVDDPRKLRHRLREGKENKTYEQKPGFVTRSTRNRGRYSCLCKWASAPFFEVIAWYGWQCANVAANMTR